MLERLIANLAARMLKDHTAVVDALEAAHLEPTQAAVGIDAAKALHTRLLADDKRETALPTLVERIELQAVTSGAWQIEFWCHHSFQVRLAD